MHVGGVADDAALEAFVEGPGDDGVCVRVNMVTSVDGATASDGESRGLSGPADRRVFHRLRAWADVIVAGASTVRADRYGPARVADDVRERRSEGGRAHVPAIAVVSASLDLDWGSPLFTAAEVPTLVVHPDGARLPREATRGTVESVPAGTDRVDPVAMRRAFAARGLRRVLVEGGPGLIGQFVTAGAVDEVFVAISPRLVGGDSPRLMRTRELRPPADLNLTGALHQDGFLFLRYHLATEAP